MSPLTLYNSLGKKKEIFVPIDAQNITMYVCGPTVYDDIHIGNARSQIVYDVLYRILINIYGKKHVKYVQNITDVDDKIIEKANFLGINSKELTQNTIQNFLHDIKYLNCLETTARPKATDYIQDIIELIKSLISSNYAYIVNGSVYFNTLKAKDYYQLLNKNNLDYRQETENLSEKRQAADFSLWKKSKDTEKICDLFKSPWGLGRPGWHIECSCMIYKVLGKTIDIHGGGIDLKFPHHTNEIAQSTCVFGTNRLANFWLHNELLTIEKQKMSKSLNNIVKVKELQGMGISSGIFRTFILNTHYRKQITFSQNNIQSAERKFNYILSAAKHAKSNIQDFLSYNMELRLPNEFIDFLLKDVNTHLALEYIVQLAKQIHKNIDVTLNADKMLRCANFLGLITYDVLDNLSQEEGENDIEDMILRRNLEKQNKNWQAADAIRNKLLEKGIKLEDKKDGSTTWQKST
jgi:cysteinyl-tRNA synthetase